MPDFELQSFWFSPETSSLPRIASYVTIHSFDQCLSAPKSVYIFTKLSSNHSDTSSHTPRQGYE